MQNIDSKIDLTICIPAYESKFFLKRALNSVAPLKGIKLEILVSDDSKKNDLLGTVISFKNDNPELIVHYHKQRNNLGVAYNKKWLLENSQGTLVSFLEHDDSILDYKFYFDTIAEFTKDNYYKIFFGNTLIEEKNIERNMQMYLPSTNGELLPLKKYYFIRRFLRTSKFNFISLSWSSVVFDRQAILDLGGFSTKYLMTPSQSKSVSSFHNEENMMFLILAASYYGIKYTSSNVSKRYLSNQSFSNSNFGKSKNKNLDCEFINLIRISTLIDNCLIRYFLIKKAIWIGIPKYDKKLFHIIGDSSLNRIIVLISFLSYKIYNPLAYLPRLVHGYLIRLARIIRSDPSEIILRLNHVIRKKV